jgi:hypothetical protein
MVRPLHLPRWLGVPLLALAVFIGLNAIPSGAGASSPSCRLGGPTGRVKHVIYIQFDNVHLRRDDPRVPSDLQQMPHLLDFIENHGVMLTRQYTPLVSHTADDILTSITGLYGDRQGMPIANEYEAYNPNGTTFTAGSFAYWTDPVVSYSSANSKSSDPLPTFVGPGGKNPPAPWVPYTRAGCNWGSVAAADTELENTTPDIAQVFGAGSAPAQEAASDSSRAQTDYMGLSIHCAKGATLCSSAHGGVSDTLPDEPDGYTGFRALFGNKYIAPAIVGANTFRNLDGHPITDSSGHPGFPGYDSLQPVNALAYTLALQEHGVPVTFTYVSSAHENAGGTQWGPGQAAYVAQLKSFDTSFAEFFSQLAAHGITPANTLFVIGSDENDQFVGSRPEPAGCNGVKTPCHYRQIGEIDENVQGLLAQHGIRTPFGLAADSAPDFYLNQQPAASSRQVRRFERAASALEAFNPYTHTRQRLSQYVADPTELRLLHMVTGDPRRTPTFAMFAKPSYWVLTNGPTCKKSCSSFDSEAWNHGDVQHQITDTWMGFVGPGVSHLTTSSVWSDHTDIQPTMMALLGLRDDYVPEGRVLEEILKPSARPAAAAASDYTELAGVYKQIEAPLGQLAAYTLDASTKALTSNALSDSTYRRVENQLEQITTSRNAIGAEMITLLDDAAFGNQAISPHRSKLLEREGRALIARAQHLASTA